jgi:hypothetical protein
VVAAAAVVITLCAWCSRRGALDDGSRRWSSSAWTCAAGVMAWPVPHVHYIAQGTSLYVDSLPTCLNALPASCKHLDARPLLAVPTRYMET